MLRYLTSGESHGKCLVSIVDGIPAGLFIDKARIDAELSKRMLGYGRGKRMHMECDKVNILAGLRKSLTIGSPIALMIENRDHSIDSLPAVLEPRPGHADLAGVLKYGFKDARDVLERASARETASRVAVGSIARILLSEFGIKVLSHVTAIDGVLANTRGMSVKDISANSGKSPVNCADPKASKLMCREIDRAIEHGDTLGGMFEVIITGVPAGLGSYAQWDKRLDAILARAVMSIQAIKGVSLGLGFESAIRKGSLVQDEIFYDKKKGFYRNSNNAGGVEGGMSNGEHIIVRSAMKPIATLAKPLASVNIKTKKAVRASVQRSDICAVPAAGVVAEAVCAVEIANAMIDKFGGDSIREMRRNYDGYIKELKKI